MKETGNAIISGHRLDSVAMLRESIVMTLLRSTSALALSLGILLILRGGGSVRANTALYRLRSRFEHG